MSNRAWVTLATNDSYGLGALVVAHSLRRAGSAYPAVVLITPSVTEAMRDRLRAVFADVVMVDVLDSKDATHLALLQRPELGITFTKLHCWSLIQYEKCVFLDADTLIVQNCDELFEREELSAAPDVGWPDCFNSGVFVFKPSAETFDGLVKFAQEKGSFDGGDQGLLNSYFSDWAHGDINKHLPFLYNVTSAAFYSYIPALKHYGQNLKIIHFIGAAKPWLQQFNWQARTAEGPQHLREFLQLWWDIFVGDVHSVLDVSMVEIEEALPAVSPPETFVHTEPRLDYPHYEPILDPESEFPWHHPDAQIPDADINIPEIDVTQYHDPWDIYRGHIPPNIVDSSPRHIETQKTDDHEEMRKYAWDYMSPSQTDTSYSQNVDVQSVWGQTQFEHVEPSHLDFRGNVWDYNPQHNYNNYDEQSYNNFFQNTPHYETQHVNTNQYTPDYEESHYCQDQHDNDHMKNLDKQAHFNDTLQFLNQDFSHNDSNIAYSFEKDSEKTYFPIHTQQTRVEHVYHVHIDHEKEINKTENIKTDLESKINGHGEADFEFFENVRPRHPYDGFYLRHRMTIDSRGRKICIHEVPPTPTPTPPESPAPEDIWNMQSSENEEIIQNGTEDHTGVAGNLARVVLGDGAQREALDDLTRRQGWEAGNIDYMGADAFDNIWAKISQTLSQPRVSPPKQSSPPPQVETPAPPAPVEVAKSVPESPVTQAPADTPASDSAPAAIILEASVPSEPPVPEPKSEVAETEASVEESKVPESPEAIQSSESVAVKTAPIPSVVPTAAPVSTKVVAAVPTEEPKVAAPASAPAVPVNVLPSVVPSESKPAELKPVESKPAEPKPAEAKDAESKPAESKPVETNSAESKPAESKPAEPKPAKVASITPPKVVSTPEPALIATAAAPSSPIAPKAQVTPVKGASTTDSPPLANTPSKEDVPIVPAAKSEERRKPAGKLQLNPPAAADPLPTPDSALEDAAALAHAIIASEQQLSTPTVTSPSPPADPASPPPLLLTEQRLSVEEPELPTPPVGAVSLSQIGVNPQQKAKCTTAAQIESSVTEAAADAPKKKVVKKVLKKEGVTGGEAPVPPPRKKEKKPKDK